MSSIAATQPTSNGQLRVSLPAPVPSSMGEIAASGKPKAHRATKQSKIKRRTWKKPKDKPKRPLSAYNLFFQHERANILASVALVTPPDSPRSNEAGGTSRGRRKPGPSGIGFANLARNIAQKWKNLDAQARSAFEANAAVEKKRYKEEMDAWMLKKKLLAQLDAANQLTTPAIAQQQRRNEQPEENPLLAHLNAASQLVRTTTVAPQRPSEQRHEGLVQSNQHHPQSAAQSGAISAAPLFPPSGLPSLAKPLQMPDLIGSVGMLNMLPSRDTCMWNGTVPPAPVPQPDQVLSQPQPVTAGSHRNLPILLEPLDITGTGNDDFVDLLSSFDFEGF